MENAKEIIRSMFNFFSSENNLKHYEIRKEFIETFTPVIISMNETYSYIVEEKHILKFGFRLTSSIVFQNYKKSYFDKKENMIEFDFKNRKMSISNANNEDFYLIRNAKINNLMIFSSIMVSLGFNCS